MKDNCNINGLHNTALNQNLEGLTKLFAGKAVAPNCFLSVTTAFVHPNNPSSFLLTSPNYSLVNHDPSCRPAATASRFIKFAPLKPVRQFGEIFRTATADVRS
jgi:hypothetical protein